MIKNSSVLFSFIIFTISLLSCKKNEGVINNEAEKKLQIDSVAKVSLLDFKIYVTINNDLNLHVTERGVCWDVITNPTARINKNVVGGVIVNSFSTTISLAPTTTYYVRGYCVKGTDTIYSDNFKIQTAAIELLLNKQISGNLDHTQIKSVTGNEIDGFVIASSMVQQYSTGYHLRLTKINSMGDVIWDRYYQDGTSKEPLMIKSLSDGYLVAFHYWKNPEIITLFRKFDFNGNLIWERELHKKLQQFVFKFEPNSNNIKVTIRAQSTPILTDPNRTVSLWDFTLGFDGTILNEQELPNYTSLDGTNINYRIIQEADGSIFTYSDYGHSYTNHDITAHLLDNQYTLIWEKMYQTNNLIEVSTTRLKQPNGNYLIGGYRYQFNSYDRESFLFEIDKTTGNKRWEKFYKKPNLGNQYVIQRVTNNNSAIYLGGVAGSTTSKVLFSKYNFDGELIWDFEVPNPPPHTGATVDHIYRGSNNITYLFGTRRDLSISSSVPSIFMIKIKD